MRPNPRRNYLSTHCYAHSFPQPLLAKSRQCRYRHRWGGLRNQFGLKTDLLQRCCGSFCTWTNGMFTQNKYHHWRLFASSNMFPLNSTISKQKKGKENDILNTAVHRCSLQPVARPNIERGKSDWSNLSLIETSFTHFYYLYLFIFKVCLLLPNHADWRLTGYKRFDAKDKQIESQLKDDINIERLFADAAHSDTTRLNAGTSHNVRAEREERLCRFRVAKHTRDTSLNQSMTEYKMISASRWQRQPY